jgi:hypothetical protein
VITLNDSEGSTVVNALRIAAAVYIQDADTMRKHGMERNAKGFMAQAHEANELADKIETA